MKKQILITVLAASLFFTQDAKAAEIQFKDVAKTNPYYEIIHQMRDQKIISGYENGMFKPNDNIQRKHGAALVSRAVELPSTTAYVAFKDVSTSNANHAAIKGLQMAGIFKADSKGNFNPNVDMTRGEMAKVIATAFNLKIENTGKSSFKDVKVNSEYSPYIEALAKANITTGYGDGTFKPTGSLSRAHFAVFMHRAMEFKETGSVTGSDAVTPAPKPVTPPKEETKPAKVVENKDYFYQKEKPKTVEGAPKEFILKGSNQWDILDNLSKYKPSHVKDPKKLSQEHNRRFEKEILATSGGDDGAYGYIRGLGFGEFTKGEQQTGIEDYAKRIGISTTKLEQALNYVLLTGEYYHDDDADFYVYANYDDGSFTLGYYGIVNKVKGDCINIYLQTRGLNVI